MAVRIPGLWGDLWLDEVWSLLNLEGVDHPAGILSLFDDNNHPLNSVWLWILSSAQPAWSYRMLSLVASIGSVVALFFCGRAIDQRLALPAAFLGSCNYLLVLYGTEARGYSSMVFGVLLIAWGTLRISKQDTASCAALIAVGTVLGALGHGSFIFPWLGAALTGFWISLQRNPSAHVVPRIVRSIFQSIMLFGPGAAVIGLLWERFYRFLPEGTGPLGDHLQIAFDYFATLAGGEQLSAANPALSFWMAALALLIATVLFVETVLLLRSRSVLGVLALSTAVSTLLVGIVFLSPRVLFVRYFLSTVPLALLLLASFAIRVGDRSRFSRALITVCCAGYLFGNGMQWWMLLNVGRGDARGAFKEIAAASATGAVAFDTDQDFRAGVLLQYFRRQDPTLGRLVLSRSKEGKNGCPRAFLRSSQDRFEQFPLELSTSCGAKLHKVATFESAMLSGERFAAYR